MRSWFLTTFEQDFGEELRTRRSIIRVEDGPIFKSPSKQTSDSQSSSGVTSINFFHCLKMAADNVRPLFLVNNLAST
jgi:hypothetical protein